MLWGITPESWAQLWSGIFGAFVAAVVGGLVALLVVRLTNSHQSHLAHRAREVAALSELLASTAGMARQFTESLERIDELVWTGDAAAARITMEARHSGLESEIFRWPFHIGLMAMEALVRRKDAPEGSPTEEWSKHVQEAQAELRTFCVLWPKATTEGQRDRLVKNLKEARLDRELKTGKKPPESTITAQA